MYFKNYRLWKTWLEHSLESAVSKHALKVNMWKCPKYFGHPSEGAFIMFFMLLIYIDLEDVSASVT